MRRFMVHLVTEIDFVDGDNASDEIVQNYQKHLSASVQNAAQALSPRTIKDSERRSLRHRVVRQLRSLRRCQRRPDAGDPDSPRGRQTAPLQQLRRPDDLDPPRLAYEPTAGGS